MTRVRSEPTDDVLSLVHAMFAARDRLEAMGPSRSNAEFDAAIQSHVEALERLRQAAAGQTTPSKDSNHD